MNSAGFALFVLSALVAAPGCWGATRHYYLAAEDVMWDYAPSGLDLLHGRPIPPPWNGQTKWAKTRYIEYADGTFSRRKPQPDWLGVLGPIIRAEVGDTIVVEFLNRSGSAHSIHPHGVRYDKANEGALYLPLETGARVPPGGHFTYHWFADEGSGPGPGQPSSVVWWYHPHTDESQETNAGLLGAIIITARGKAKPDGSPKDVDREFITLFMVFDQLRNKDCGLFHAINGYVFGNLPGLIMKQGERVRWHLLGMGNERDLHTPHWHGKTVRYGARYTDVIELLPASMVTVDMVADNPGTWLFHCQVSDHMEAGMMATYTIYQSAHRSCPVEFSSGDFWHEAGKFRIGIKNTGNKTIRNMVITFDHLMTPQYRRRPYENKWTWSSDIRPGQEQTIDLPGYLPGYADTILAWALFPRTVAYQDGSIWHAQQEDECFKVFWRDQEHPEGMALPPVQVEASED